MSQSIINFTGKKVHFIGIGGIGMSALARFLHCCGSKVSGSDKSSSPLIDELKAEGIENIWTSHSQSKLQVIKPDLIVYSTAIKSTNNEEFDWAIKANIETIHRSTLLEHITNTKNLIAISGTHGKTTTSSMVTHMLVKCNIDTSAIVGGILNFNGKNFLIGKGDLFVIEADESDKSFLKSNPQIGIITNIESDHLENYDGNFENVKDSFLQFAKKAMQNKGLIACFEDKVTKELITQEFGEDNEKIISYGFYDEAVSKTFSAQQNNGTWKIFHNNQCINTLTLTFPGKHNALNALATYIVGYMLNIDSSNLKEAIESYAGVQRRFQYIKKSPDLTIVDDYAHHPTEVTATIQAAQELNPKRLIIVLQPHHPRRLKDLWNEFIACFNNVDDITYICDTYVARGGEIEDITSKKLVESISKPNIHYIPGNINEIAQRLISSIEPNDFVLIMGAGDITNLGYKLAEMSNQSNNKACK